MPVATPAYVVPDYWDVGYADGDGFYLLNAELQKAAPSAVIELFELELNTADHGVNETYRFHAGTSLNANGEIVWDGNSYLRFPVEADGFEYNGQGQLPRPKLRVSNILGTITAILMSLPDGLERAKVTRIRTLARYLDAVNFPGSVNPYGTPDPTAEFPREIYYIDRKAAENRDLVEFELAAAFDLTGVRAPKRQCISSICQWRYRSAECGYTAAGYYDAGDNSVATLAEDVCGKRLSSCEVRFAPFIKTGSVTSGSNVLTLNNTTGILPSTPVRGFGLPSTTVVATLLSATTVQISNIATATTNVTVNATPSATAATMTVTSATGIAVGHTVSGLYMNGATVTGVSGTTVSLSQRPYSFDRNGEYNGFYGTDWIQLSNTSGITVGMKVFGSLGVNTSVADVISGERIQLLIPLDSGTESETPVTLYFMPASPSSASYTFTANTSYSFRDPSSALPFGGFPGVGAYN